MNGFRMNEKEFGEFKDDVIKSEWPWLTCEINFGCWGVGGGRGRGLLMEMRMGNKQWLTSRCDIGILAEEDVSITFICCWSATYLMGVLIGRQCVGQ